MFRADRSNSTNTAKEGGGVAIIINNNWQCEIYQHRKRTFIEYIGILAINNVNRIAILNVYIPPRTMTKASKEFPSVFKRFHGWATEKHANNFIVVGDFNIHINWEQTYGSFVLMPTNNTSKAGKKIIHSMTDKAIFNCNYHRNIAGNLIDLICLSSPTLIRKTIEANLIDSNTRDGLHFGLEFELEIMTSSASSQRRNKNIFRTNIKLAAKIMNAMNFTSRDDDYIYNATFSPELTTTDIEMDINKIKYCYEVATRRIRLDKSHNNKHPFLKGSKIYLKAFKEKRAAAKLYMTTHNHLHKLLYTNCSIRLRDIFTDLKRKYHEKMIGKGRGRNLFELWRYRKRAQHEIPNRMFNGDIKLEQEQIHTEFGRVLSSSFARPKKFLSNDIEVFNEQIEVYTELIIMDAMRNTGGRGYG